MNHNFFGLTLLIVPIIASCTPEQINSAIDACKGDPACFKIVDEAIEEELADRGITGGTMTNLELDQVYTFLEQYLITDDGDVNGGIVSLLNDYGYPDNNLYFAQRMLYHEDPNGLPNNIFDFRTINMEDKQKVLRFGDKYLVYKVGNQQFRYEVYRSRSYILNIDLELSAFYWENFKFLPPVVMLDQMLNDYYPNHNVTLQSTEDYYIVNSLQHAIYGEYDLDYFTSGSLGFYSRISRKYFSLSVSGAFGPFNDRNYDFGIHLSQSSGLQSIASFNFILNETFQGTIEQFLEKVIAEDGISFHDYHVLENSLTLVNDFNMHVEGVFDYDFDLFINEISII